MIRLALERHQVWIYALAIVLGAGLGQIRPGLAPSFEVALWPVLVLLLYVTFLQVPLLHLRDAFRDRRFLCAVLLGNFVLVPAAVWLMLPLLPADAPLRLGVLLVLLVPCTDWFITFSQLGRGNVPRAITVTPVNLVLQLLLLPVYLGLMAGQVGTLAVPGPLDTGDVGLAEAAGPAVVAAADGIGVLDLFSPAVVWPALLIVGLPLAAAVLSERWMEARPGRGRWREHAAWAPVPLMAGVMLLIAAAQSGALRSLLPQLLAVVPVFVGFLVLAWGLAEGLARAFRLPADQGRTLAFSLGTRNSFVVLPLALALPVGWEATAMVVVLQSLVELLGMLVYLWVMPRRFTQGS